MSKPTLTKLTLTPGGKLVEKPINPDLFNTIDDPMTDVSFDDLAGDVIIKEEKKVSVTKKKDIILAKEVVIVDKSVTLNGYFKMSLGNYKILHNNIINGVNTMLIGPTGFGKTEVVSNMAQVLDMPLTIFDMGTMTDPIMGLVGTHVITVKDGKTFSEFRKSRFSDIIQQPGIILLDEISRASATANNLLFPVLDYRKELSMEYAFNDTTPIKIHPECVFFSTANVGSQYTGTHKLDRALLDRFMLIEVDPLSTTEISQSLKVTHSKLSATEIKLMVDVFTKINTMHDEFKITFNMSMRHLKNIASLVENDFTIYDGFLAICKGLGGKEGLSSIQVILDTLTDTKKK